MINNGSRIVLPFDGLALDKALEYSSTIGSRAALCKIHDLWDLEGPGVVKKLQDSGAARVWVDLKLHDIPKTVGRRAKAVAASGAEVVTVHASGGIAMMKAAAENIRFVLAISVLTSLSEDNTHLTYGDPAKATVIKLARLAVLAGVYGLVCSPKEVAVVREQPELAKLKLFVPGIRRKDNAVQDQKRVDDPTNTIKAGADYLVIGSPILEDKNPFAAFESFDKEISGAAFERAQALVDGR